MRMKRMALIGALALAGVPAGALAAQPSHPATPANSHANSNANATSTTSSSSSAASAKVMFVLRGTLTAYTAASGGTNGSVTITVKSSNFDSKTLKTMSLTFVVDSNTRVTLHEGKFTPNDNGIVKVRAAKNNTTWTGLTATQVIDQGAAH
jgi:uncharacterized protein YdeI (BOF family)